MSLGTNNRNDDFAGTSTSKQQRDDDRSSIASSNILYDSRLIKVSEFDYISRDVPKLKHDDDWDIVGTSQNVEREILDLTDIKQLEEEWYNDRAEQFDEALFHEYDYETSYNDGLRKKIRYELKSQAEHDELLNAPYSSSSSQDSDYVPMKIMKVEPPKRRQYKKKSTKQPQPSYINTWLSVDKKKNKPLINKIL